MLMSYNDIIDHNKLIFDAFICSDSAPNKFDENILRHGGRIYEAPGFAISKIGAIKRAFSNTLKENSYDIIHIHSVNSGFAFLKIAKENGVRNRIVHAHSTKLSDSRFKAIRNYFLKKINSRYITKFAACSMPAAVSTFGSRKIKKYGVQIIRNITDVNKFTFNREIREKVRCDFEIADKFVIGIVGRLSNEKNPIFGLKIVKDLCKIHSNVVLMIIGDGPLKDKIKKDIISYGLAKKVIMTGSRIDVNELLNAMDAFVMPSKFEGFGSSLVEAQINGLPCFASENVPKETNLGLCEYLPLKDGIKIWVDRISKTLAMYKLVERGTPSEIPNNFDLTSDLVNWYIKMVNNV